MLGAIGVGGTLDANELIAFEGEVAVAFEAKKIRGPIHLSGGNEEHLISLFKIIKAEDWVLSTWRSHYHALLKGVPPGRIMADILAGRSMMLHYPEYKFLTSAIVGGILPIACGLASAGERVWCFIGDMAARGGAFHEARRYAVGHDLNVRFIIEDNGLSTNTPTAEAWGTKKTDKGYFYPYTRTVPHCGSGTYVQF